MASTYNEKGEVTEVPQEAHRIEFDTYGPPSVLKYVMAPVAAPQASEVLIKHHAIGVNFIDNYFRTGLYPVEKLPAAILGSEGAGVVQSVGSEVKNFQPGDRVVYYCLNKGSYAEYIAMDQTLVAKIPDGVSYEVAAAAFLKGLTAHYLLRQIHKLKKDDVALFHAAAGGVGLIAMQWARSLGAKLIATASTDEKCQLAAKFGAWKTINYKKEDVVQKVLEYTDGKKVPLVYDSVGKDTFETSINCLSRRGLLVSFGNASGAVVADLGILSARGSLFVTRPTLSDYSDDLPGMADELFALMKNGDISIEINQRYKLSDAQKCHEDLEGRKTIGASILYPTEYFGK